MKFLSLCKAFVLINKAVMKAAQSLQWPLSQGLIGFSLGGAASQPEEDADSRHCVSLSRESQEVQPMYNFDASYNMISLSIHAS